MKFTHRSYETGQTITAVATPPGEGGIAVIRISGNKALTIANKVFSGPITTYLTHTAHVGKILDTNGSIIDEGLALIMKGPHSYTGEDTVEIHCHGGKIITRKVLKAALDAGARAALPGEFTFKAFQNGKIDLTKAEAIQKVIASQSELAWQAAENHLEGKLHQKIVSFQQDLTETAAILEAFVDFPEEGLEFASKEEIIDHLNTTVKEMEILHQSFHEGKILQTHLSLCLIGAPNVGKSSLMNALCGKERAIVTEIAGTTRDVLEEEIELAGLTFQLTDTAGIHQTEEVIEKEGIRRSKKAAKSADLILLILDVTNPTINPEILAALPEKNTIAIWNKTDLTHDENLQSLPFSHVVKLSAKEGLGLNLLKETIKEVVLHGKIPSKEEVVLTSARHFQALGNAILHLNTLIKGLSTDLSAEFLTSDMKATLRELGTIIGTDITEEILDAIFSKFCVGK